MRWASLIELKPQKTNLNNSWLFQTFKAEETPDALENDSAVGVAPNPEQDSDSLQITDYEEGAEE